MAPASRLRTGDSSSLAPAAGKAMTRNENDAGARHHHGRGKFIAGVRCSHMPGGSTVLAYGAVKQLVRL